MIVNAYLSIGFASPCTRRKEVFIDDRDLEGLTAQAREQFISDEVREWAFDYIDWGWTEDETDSNFSETD